MGHKFKLYANKYYEEIRQHYVESVREALKRAIEVAVRNTVHDSSQAGAYWMIGLEGFTDPKNRTPTSLGGTGFLYLLHGEGPVGQKGDGGANYLDTVSTVVDRETQQVIDKYITGQVFPTKVFFYNKVTIMDGSPGRGHIEYPRVAGIHEAGAAAMETAKMIFSASLKKKRYR